MNSRIRIKWIYKKNISFNFVKMGIIKNFCYAKKNSGYRGLAAWESEDIDLKGGHWHTEKQRWSLCVCVCLFQFHYWSSGSTWNIISAQSLNLLNSILHQSLNLLNSILPITSLHKLKVLIGLFILGDCLPDFVFAYLSNVKMSIICNKVHIDSEWWPWNRAKQEIHLLHEDVGNARYAHSSFRTS